MSFFHNPSITTDGLIQYYDAKNLRSAKSGSDTWYDLTGNYDGTITRATYNERGWYNFSGSLYGTDEYIQNTDIEFESGSDWTISQWQNVSSPVRLGWTGFCGKTLYDGGYWMWHGGGKLFFYLDYFDSTIWGVGPYNNLRVGVEAPLDKWFNITIRYDASASECTAIVNDNEYSETLPLRWSPKPLTSVKFAYVGRGAPTRNFKGDIATHMIWNRQLTNEEIERNYVAMKGRFIKPDELELYNPDQDFFTTYWTKWGSVVLVSGVTGRAIYNGEGGVRPHAVNNANFSLEDKDWIRVTFNLSELATSGSLQGTNYDGSVFYDSPMTPELGTNVFDVRISDGEDTLSISTASGSAFSGSIDYLKYEKIIALY